jgi:arylsulfatase A-like enzyme
MSDFDAHRAVLPIIRPRDTRQTPNGWRKRETRSEPTRGLRPPDGAPNVLLILLDDVGFGAASAFGGPCSTPTAEGLARAGLTFRRFHTCGLGSATRAALLSGRNNHAGGAGRSPEVAATALASLPDDAAAPLAKILNLNGYSTAQFGKCSEVPAWEVSPIGPFRHWPTGAGFDHFYGFVGGEADQWRPTLYSGATPIEAPAQSAQTYHLAADLADKAIAWATQQKSLAPDKPFFIYFAPGATHAPHHVPHAWADRYRGKFDDGWDALRGRTLRRQKQLGVAPRTCELTPRPKSIPAWDDMPAELKPVLRRQMEIYAGYLEFADYQVGRLVAALDGLDALDNTLVCYILGDNGASAEGTLQGAFNQIVHRNGMSHVETAEFLREHIDQMGGPTSYGHYSMGWAHAMGTPFQGAKRSAAYLGGTRNGAIMSWPNGFQARAEIRDQFHHVVDIAPTILDAAGLPEPVIVGGMPQTPFHGVSMRYCFDERRAAGRHETQHFEAPGSRSIYHQGWTAVANDPPLGRPPGERRSAFVDGVWELYDSAKDWAQAADVAADFPEKLEELQRLWLIEAIKYDVLSPDDDLRKGNSGPFQGLLAGRNTQVLSVGMPWLPEAALLNLKNRSHSLTADIVVTELPANGVLLCQGAGTGGWSLYVKDGRLKYCYNLGGVRRFHVEARRDVAAGSHQVRMEFTYDGGGPGRGGGVSLYIDGREVGSGRVDATLPSVFSAYDGCFIARDPSGAVSDDYRPGSSAFNGEIAAVTLFVDKRSWFAERESSTEHLAQSLARQ